MTEMAVSEGNWRPTNYSPVESRYPIELHRKLAPAPSEMVALSPKKQNSRAVNLIDLNSNIDEQDTITEKSNYQIQEIIA